MHQSSTPGMDGGRRRARILASSSIGIPLSCSTTPGSEVGSDEVVLGPGSLSGNGVRGCGFICTGRRITTCDFDVPTTEHDKAVSLRKRTADDANTYVLRVCQNWVLTIYPGRDERVREQRGKRGQSEFAMKALTSVLKLFPFLPPGIGALPGFLASSESLCESSS